MLAEHAEVLTLLDEAERGSIDVFVTGATADVNAVVVDDCLQVGPAGVAEYRFVREIRQRTVLDATDSSARLRLDAAARPVVRGRCPDPADRLHRRAS